MVEIKTKKTFSKIIVRIVQGFVRSRFELCGVHCTVHPHQALSAKTNPVRSMMDSGNNPAEGNFWLLGWWFKLLACIERGTWIPKKDPNIAEGC